MSYSSVFRNHSGIDKNDFQQALTHASFFESGNETKANSRLIFAGMFVFKGQVAEILMDYFTGKGTQLQQLLGNLFRNEYLHRLFDKWLLMKHVRASKNFDIKAHKHIFVFAVLGCVARLDDETRHRFIFKWFLNDENKHVFQHTVKNVDLQYQVDLLTKKVYNEHLKIKVEQSADGFFSAKTMLNDGFVVSEALSKSYRYARKKALKIALLLLSEIKFSEFIRSTDYIERVKARIENERAEKLRLANEATELKKIQKAAHQQKMKEIKVLRDAQRRKAQAEAKKRKAEREKIRAAKAAKEQRPLSANKRRHLEDKQK
jgi:dsRNA-specific ribonuclease